MTLKGNLQNIPPDVLSLHRIVIYIGRWLFTVLKGLLKIFF